MEGNNFTNNNNNVPLFLGQLDNIGKRLLDFEEIKTDKKNYFLLGKGNFGYAEKMKSRINNNFYAIKKLRKDDQKFKMKDFQRETQNMINLQHENIIKFYGYFIDQEKIEKFNDIYSDMPDRQIINRSYVEVFCLVLEFASNGSLNGLYKSIKEKNSGYYVPIEQELIIKFLKQSLKALYYLGSKSILHRDIQPDNLLLDEGFNIKITDFGISALYYDQNQENLGKDKNLFCTGTVIGREDFVAPEVAKGEQYDFRIDTYSLGLTILCFMSESYPITLTRLPNFQNAIRNVSADKMDKKYDINLKNLVLKMIDNNKEERPFANQALQMLENIEQMINNQNNKKNWPQNQNNQNAFINKSNTFPHKNLAPNNFGMNNIPNISPQNNPKNPIYIKGNNFMFNPFANFQNIFNNIQFQPIRNINHKNNTNINRIANNTSLTRVLQCLCDIYKNDISLKNTRFILDELKKYKPQISISLDIINIIDFINNNQNLNINNFCNKINNFRMKLSKKSQNFQGTNEISPKFVFHDLFSIFNKEMKECDIPWNNNTLDGLIEPMILPKNSYPDLYGKIEFFKSKYTNLFVDFFYFMLLDLVKCSNCNRILNLESYVASFIALNSFTYDNVTNLMRRELINKPSNLNGYFYCPNCRSKTIGICEKKLLNSPKYLIIDFFGSPKNQKNLDDEIDMSYYIVSNIGPRKYKLYGYICEAQNGKFTASIKGYNIWKIYSEENDFDQYSIKDMNNCSPYIAIYRGC